MRQPIRVDEPTGISASADTDLGALATPTQATTYKYDAFGKMVEVTQCVQHRYFKYDALGRLLRVRQPEQEVNANLATSGNPNNNDWTAGFAYDLLGNVVRATDANGVNIFNDYDRAGRVVKRCYTKPNIITSATSCAGIAGNDVSTDTPAVSFFYDGIDHVPQQTPHNFAKGKLTKVTSSVSETRNELFDNFGRVTRSSQITDGSTYTSKYTYNFAGALVEEEYPSGRKVKNEFEADGDLASVTSRKTANGVYTPYVSNFSYTASGGISQMKLGNGRWETAKFNTRMQVTELGLGTNVTDANLWKTNYEYGELDSNGNTDPAKNTGNIAKQILTVPGTNFIQAYKYDSLYRITEAKETTGSNTTPNWIQNWGYDRYGNRTAFSQNIAGNTAATNPAIDQNTNRFSNLSDFAYDKNGNITRDISPGSQLRTFVFNGDNKQTEVKDANGATVGQYYYDGEGKRVKKYIQSTGETTVFVYSSGKLVAEYSTIVAPASAAKVAYTTTDHLGSPRVITDALGQVASRRDFMPFGEDLNVGVGNRTGDTGLKYSMPGDNVRQKFTGYQKDIETQLDFAEARMYENRFARFTAVDPLLASGMSANPQTFNRYVYVLNNPLSLIDIDGQKPVWWRRREGNIYRYKISDGSPGDGYKEYTGSRTVVAERHDFGNRWYLGTRGAYAIRDRESDRPLSSAPRSSSSAVAKTTPSKAFRNDAFISAAADQGQKSQAAMFIAASGGVVLGLVFGGCIALCGPTLGYLAATYAPVHASYPFATYLGTFSLTFAVGLSGERVVNGNSDIDKRNPSDDVPNVFIDSVRFPGVAAHVNEAQLAGYPSVLTIDRPGAIARSLAARSQLPPRPGFDRDEYPPAVFLEGGTGASLHYIIPGDNRGAGGSLRQQLSPYADGEQVRIVVRP